MNILRISLTSKIIVNFCYFKKIPCLEINHHNFFFRNDVDFKNKLKKKFSSIKFLFLFSEKDFPHPSMAYS